MPKEKAKFSTNIFHRKEEILEKIITAGAIAEPYKPEKTAGKQQLVDLSGLDMFKEQKSKSTKSLKQYAENDKAVTKSDTDIIQKSEDYIDYFYRDVNDLCKDEGYFRPYAYFDSADKPNLTIGCGINIDQTPNIKLYHAKTGEILSDQQLKQEILNLKNILYLTQKQNTMLINRIL